MNTGDVEQGVRGEQGVQGIQGAQGVQGIQGPKGTSDRRWHLDKRVVVPVLVGLLLLISYQVWAYRQHSSAVAAKSQAAEVAKTRAAVTCPQLTFLYATLVQLMVADPSFTQAQVAAMRAQGINRIAACKAAP